MLVICEDCAKKYNIDESRIKGRRARFTCNECGHIIIVDKEDLNRSLLSGKSKVTAENQTVDLLRDLQSPLSTEEEGQGEASAGTEKTLVKKKNRGMPVFSYFMLVMLFALVCISIVTGYLFSEFLNVDQRSDIMLQATLIFGGAWIVVFLFSMVLAGMVDRKFKQLVKNVNQLAAGEYEVSIAKQGPREVLDLASALEKIQTRLKSNV